MNRILLGFAALFLLCGCEFTLFNSTSGNCDKGATPYECANPSVALSFAGENDFGTLDFLQSADITLELTNSGRQAAGSLALSTSHTFLTVQDTDCTASLAAGSVCHITVRFSSPGQGSFSPSLILSFEADGKSGNSSFTFSAAGTSVSGGAVAATYPNNGANWNAHVANDGATPFEATDTACTAGEPWPWGCLNGGLYRKVVVPSLDNCDGITAEDALGAFEWVCLDSVSPVEIHSTGLKPDKGLADLVDATAWKSNQVTVYRHGYAGYVTASGPWHTNPVAVLPDNSGGADSLIVLDAVDDDGGGPDQSYAAGTVFTLSADRASQGYLLNNLNEVSFVTLNGSTLTYGNKGVANCNSAGSTAAKTHECLLTTGAERWLWIEGNYQGAGLMDFVIFSYGGRHNQYRRLSASKAGDLNGAVVAVVSCNHCLLDQVQAAESVGRAFEINDNDNTVVMNLRAYNTGSTAVYAPNNLYGIGVNWIVAGGTTAVDLDHFVLSHATILNSSTGLSMDSAADTNTVLQTVVANHTFFGVYNDSANNQFSQLVAAHADTGLGVGADANSASYGIGDYASGDNILVGSNTTDDCDVDGGATNPGLDNSCATATGNTVTGVTLASSFVSMGKATSDATNTQGAGPVGANSITDWLRFDSEFRFWGKNGSDFPASNHRGRCTGGTQCRVWDVRLSASDTRLLNRAGDGVGTVSFTAGQACPALVHGDVAVTTPWGGYARTFLINAVELAGDGAGNDNGLCESNEACVLSRNFGRYQGHGNPTEVSCEFTDGTVTGVTMYSYPSNGL